MLKELERPVDSILSDFKTIFECKRLSCTCYGHAFQSHANAVVVVAVNGGSVNDVIDARVVMADKLPNCPIPLIVAHVPKDDDSHLSIGDISMAECVLWKAHNEAGVHSLRVDMGDCYVMKTNISWLGLVSTTTVRDGYVTEAVKKPVVPLQCDTGTGAELMPQHYGLTWC